MERDSFVFYRSFKEAADNLDDKDRLAFYDAVINYALDGKEVKENGTSKAMFILVKPVIDSNNTKYKNGKKGGRPKTETEPKQNQEETETKPNNKQEITEPEPYVDVYVDDNVDVDKEKNKEDKPLEFNFKNSLIVLGVEKTIANDWMKVRAKKKATNTETSFNRIKSQIEKSTLNANNCIKIAVERDWKGFEADWVKDININSEPNYNLPDGVTMATPNQIIDCIGKYNYDNAVNEGKEYVFDKVVLRIRENEKGKYYKSRNGEVRI